MVVKDAAAGSNECGVHTFRQYIYIIFAVCVTLAGGKFHV